jgi:aspartyl protease family protein
MSDDQFARTGRIMYFLVWIIIFVGFFLFFQFQGKQESTEIISNGQELTVSADRNGNYVVKGSLNEYPIEFMIDTGASLVAIPKQIADNLHLSGRYPLYLTTANGVVEGLGTRVEQLTIGSFTIHDVKAVIIPANEDGLVLLGMNVLSKFQITQQNHQVTLKPQSPN